MEKKDTQQSKAISKPLVTISVEHEFIGTQSVSDAFIPIIYDDMIRRIEPPRTLDEGKVIK